MGYAHQMAELKHRLRNGRVASLNVFSLRPGSGGPRPNPKHNQPYLPRPTFVTNTSCAMGTAQRNRIRLLIGNLPMLPI
jgi:hypothetical protein